MKEHGLDYTKYDIVFNRGKDSPEKTISEIKKSFKYKLPYNISRNIIIYIYDNLLLKDFPNILELMHLTTKQIQEIAKMGHSIGVHSHTHISVASTDLSEGDLAKELIHPKKILENIIEEPVETLSYPFGRQQDCFTSKDLVKRSNEYKLAFTVKPQLNTKKTPIFEIGRYMPMSTDNAEILKNILNDIIN